MEIVCVSVPYSDVKKKNDGTIKTKWKNLIEEQLSFIKNAEL